MSRSHNFCQEPRSSFKFSSCIKVRNVHKEFLQLCHHHQHQACILKPPMPGTSGKFANSEKHPSPQSGYGCRETPDLWSALFKASPSRGALNTLPLVCYVCELCIIPRLEILIYTYIYIYMLAHTLLLGLTLEDACVIFETIYTQKKS